MPLETDDLLFCRYGCVVGEKLLHFHRTCRVNTGIFAQVTDAEGACRAITEMIYGSQVTTPDNMALMYQLYAYASDKPALKQSCKIGCSGVARNTLAQWFDAQTARALDTAFIEG